MPDLSSLLLATTTLTGLATVTVDIQQLTLGSTQQLLEVLTS